MMQRALTHAHAMAHPLGVGTALSRAALLHLLRGDIQAVQTHTEATITANGRVRVDGRWIDTGPMHGVMEQHGGRW